MRFFAILLFFLVFSHAAPAAPPENHVTPRLFSPATATGGGETAEIGLEFKMAKGWDTYWRMPGDAGLAPVLEWEGSQNFKSYDMQWPAPHRLSVAELDNYVYEGTVIFPLTIALENPGAALELKLHLDLLVCSSEMCVPESHDLSFTLPAGAAAPSAEAALYRKALAKIPQKNTPGYAITRAWLDFDKSNKNYLVVEGAAPQKPSAHADIFVEHPSFIPFGAPKFDSLAGGKTFTARMEAHSPEPMEALKKKLSEGGFALTYVDKDAAAEMGGVSLSEKPGGAREIRGHAAIREKMEGIGISLLLAALLGGLILNLMPCVLPVLSLKILSVVSHGGKDNRRTIFRNFMASALGILCSFWLMAGALAALKAAGGAVGWGIQFQHPGFLVFLIAVLLLFAANMWGLFEIPLPRFIAKNIAAKHEHEPTVMGHFLTGAFATLLATPCTAPFLGTAVGFALARGTLEIFTIFTFLGLGLALPYILLAVSPRLFRYMPKPGKWMVTLKKILALALLATAIWLVQVLLTIWTMPTLDEGWRKFDQALIAPAVAEGKTVMVDVTADWCLTCKANKKLVLEQPDVIEALSAPNILLLQGDLTHGDDELWAYIKGFGRFGIPFNAVYGPGAPDGLVLPELLTKKAVTDALAEAAGE